MSLLPYPVFVYKYYSYIYWSSKLLFIFMHLHMLKPSAQLNSCWHFLTLLLCSLEYKYMKLVESSSGKYSEMPAPETCALDEDEDDEEHFDAVKVRKGNKFFGKFKLAQNKRSTSMVSLLHLALSLHISLSAFSPITRLAVLWKNKASSFPSKFKLRITCLVNTARLIWELYVDCWSGEVNLNVRK